MILLALLLGCLLGAVDPAPRPTQVDDPAAAARVVPAPAFERAVAAYRDRRYPAALESFAALAAEEPDPGRRAVLHANAGTAAARAHQLGEAIWHLETAGRLAPRDAVVRRNLERIRGRVTGQDTSETSQFTEALLRLPLILTPAETGRLVAALLAAALLLLAGRRAGWLGRGLTWTALILLALAGGCWLATERARAQDAQRAVVLEDAPVRAEPGPKGTVLFRLGAGTVVRDEQQRGDWVLIETAGGGRGWALVETVRRAGS